MWEEGPILSCLFIRPSMTSSPWIFYYGGILFCESYRLRWYLINLLRSAPLDQHPTHKISHDETFAFWSPEFRKLNPLSYTSPVNRKGTSLWTQSSRYLQQKCHQKGICDKNKYCNKIHYCVYKKNILLQQNHHKKL
jgi:hypothetical protein